MTDGTGAASGGARAWFHRNRRLLGITGAVIAAGMTVLWLIVVPDEADTTTGLPSFLIRYGHPAAWALLSVLGVLVAVDAPKRVKDAVGIASLVAYLAFLGALALS